MTRKEELDLRARALNVQIEGLPGCSENILAALLQVEREVWKAVEGGYGEGGPMPRTGVKRPIKVKYGDWVSFERGGPMLSYACIGLVRGIHEGSLDVVFDGKSISLLKEQILERRGNKP